MAPRVRVRFPKEAIDAFDAGVAFLGAITGAVKSAQKVVRRAKRVKRRAERAVRKLSSHAKTGPRILVDAAEGAVTVDLSGPKRRRTKPAAKPKQRGNDKP